MHEAPSQQPDITSGMPEGTMVPRPGKGLGVAGLIMGIVSLVFLGICVVPAIIVSYLGFRSRAPGAAITGYALTWIACLLWSWVLFFVVMSLGMLGTNIGSHIDDLVERPISEAVVAIRVYQLDHDNQLPDNEMGTRILQGTVHNELKKTLFSDETSRPNFTWSLQYERLDKDTWRASLITSAPDDKKRVQSEALEYEFNAAGDVIRGRQTRSVSNPKAQ